MRIFRNLLFGIFLLVIAPLEYHAKWLPLWLKDGRTFRDAALLPLDDGPLFFYSLIILVEAMMRLQGHPELMEKRMAQVLFFYALVLIIVVVAILSACGTKDPFTPGLVTAQWIITISSVLSSYLTHNYVASESKE